jgi:hypothetical protein
MRRQPGGLGGHIKFENNMSTPNVMVVNDSLEEKPQKLVA